MSRAPLASPGERSSTKAALLTVGVAGVVLLALAAWKVPWHPYPGGPLDVPPAADYFSAAEIARAERYAAVVRLWSRLSLVVSLAVACVLGFSRLGRSLVDRLWGPWWLRTVLTVLVLAVVGRLATLPFAVLVRREQLREGLSHQAWTGFARDLAVGEAVSVVMTCLGLLVLMLCARRLPRSWPAVGGGLAAVLVLVGSFVYPVLIEPLSNDFTSLPAGPLRTQILDLADAEHVAVDDVLVADASRRTTTLNAYVSGFGSTRRVVVYDNLVAALPRREALVVVAHELAHARHDDVVVGSAMGAAGAALGVGLLGLLVGRRRRLGEAVSVPWLLAVLAVASVLATPAESLVSRQIETRADADALRVTGDGAAFVELQRQLALSSLADPTPAAWSQWVWGTHPTVLQRIALAKRLTG